MYTRLTPSSSLLTILYSLLPLTLLILYARHISWRDPGSLFFDATHAYDFRYSNVRLRQSYEFLSEAANTPFHQHGDGNQATVCVGVASIARSGARYMRTTVASLLEGLTQKERDEIFLTVFIAETNASTHPAYQEAWLHNLADKILEYDLSPEKLEHFRNLEEDHALVSEKMLFDYMYLMKDCFYNTEAPYIALFEDDVLAMDGWFQRTTQGIEDVEDRTVAEEGRAEGDWLYMRLFYTEEFLGWNSEDLGSHIFWSMAVIAVIGGVLTGIRSSLPHTQAHLTRGWVLAICCIYTPLLITLFFLTGRVTTNALPTGVNKMNNYGCCAQGLVFPRHKAEDLIKWYDMAPRIGLRDSLIELYADRNHEQRWALTPSVIQHIGRTTSKVEGGGAWKKKEIPITQKLWSFPFEMFDWEELRLQHAAGVT